MKQLIAFVLICLPIFAQAQEWTPAEKGLGASALIATIADYGQTRWISECPGRTGCAEWNPVLGRRPSLGRVNVYFLGVAIVSAVGLNVMPEKYRFGTLLVLNAVEVIAVGHNAALGIHMSF